MQNVFFNLSRNSKENIMKQLTRGGKKKALFTLLQDCQRKGRDKECYQYFRTTDMTSNF